MADLSPAILREQAVGALQRRNFAGAAQAFETLLAADPRNVDGWLGMAFARSQLGDGDGALQAVDQALVLSPHNLRALLFRGDHLMQLGQSRRALASYRGALKLAERQAQQLPGDVMDGLRRAQQAVNQLGESYTRYLRERLDADGYRPGQARRFDEALAIAFGDQQPALQQPTRFYFPGLAARPFFERNEFSWAGELEAQTAAIRGEALALEPEADTHYEAYVQRSPDKVALNDTSNLDSKDWGAFYLEDRGSEIPGNAAQCPRTINALGAVPLCRVKGNMPHVLFSRLAARTRIPAHHGLINTRLICHLPLIVPDNCGALRCGNESRPWREGELLIFDDSIEHSAANHSDAARTVLIFDIWRPELGAEERHWISRMLVAVLSFEEGAS